MLWRLHKFSQENKWELPVRGCKSVYLCRRRLELLRNNIIFVNCLIRDFQIKLLLAQEGAAFYWLFLLLFVSLF